MKIKRFDISIQALKEIFSKGRKDWEVENNALPEDAKIVRIWIDENLSTPDVLSLLVTSNSYDNVAEGVCIPKQNITIRRYYND